MSHRLQHRPFLAPARETAEPKSSPVDRTSITLLIGARRKFATSKAIALEAEAVEGWHRHSVGATKSILPSRGESYGREQGEGLRVLTLSDLAEAIAVGGEAGVAAARAALAPYNRAVEDASAGPNASLDRVVADFAAESSDVTEAFLRHQSDEELQRQSDEARARLDAVDAVLAARREKPVQPGGLKQC